MEIDGRAVDVGGLAVGKIAVVVGVGPDLGRSTALALADAGADVALVARSTDLTSRVAEEIEGRGRRAWVLTADITDAGQCVSLADQLASEVGHIDILVLVPAGGAGRSIEDEDDTLSGWRSAYEVNVFGTMQVTKALLELLKASGDGRIIVVNTSASERGLPGLEAYASSKAALQSLTRTLAGELGEWGIKVNGVHPGTIVTSRLEQYYAMRASAEGTTVDQITDDEIATTVLGYLPDCADIAGAILFLASPLARAITGQALHVNAGQWPIINHPPSNQPGLRARDRARERATQSPG